MPIDLNALCEHAAANIKVQIEKNAGPNPGESVQDHAIRVAEMNLGVQNSIIDWCNEHPECSHAAADSAKAQVSHAESEKIVLGCTRHPPQGNQRRLPF